jgi:hypothetical protein
MSLFSPLGVPGCFPRRADASFRAGAERSNCLEKRMKPVYRLPALLVVAIWLVTTSAWATTNVSTSVLVLTPANLTSSGSAQNLSVTCMVNGSPQPPGGSITAHLYNSSGTSIASGGGSVSNGSCMFTLVVPANTSGTGFYVTASYSGFGNGSYIWSASSGRSGTFSIGKTTPVITWQTPAAITYGTALSATQLNATANTPGAFVYTPTSGAILAAGVQTLSVTFTPTDTTDYNSATKTVSLTVNQAPTTFALNQTSFTYNGNAQGPSIVPTPSGATFTTSGTLSATAPGTYTATATATGNYTGSNTLLTWTITPGSQDPGLKVLDPTP